MLGLSKMESVSALKFGFVWRILFLVLTVCWCTHLSTAQSTRNQDQEIVRSCRFGGFFTLGTPPQYVVANSHLPISANLKLEILSAGFEAGKVVGRRRGVGFLRGQTEARLEIVPFWLGRYPSQEVLVRYADGTRRSEAWKGQSFFGASATPILIRWNFSSERSRRTVPWLQLGGGILWTNHKFPLTMWAAPASVINFTPQIGGGVTFLTQDRRSVDLGLKVVHISNAGLGDSNPGINQTIQGVVAYSWWK